MWSGLPGGHDRFSSGHSVMSGTPARKQSWQVGNLLHEGAIIAARKESKIWWHRPSDCASTHLFPVPGQYVNLIGDDADRVGGDVVGLGHAQQPAASESAASFGHCGPI